MNNITLNLCHLYPKTMSTYGDLGNIITIRQRTLWRGFKVNICNVEIGQSIPEAVDLYFFGGGQDLAQSAVALDLQSKSKQIHQDVEKGVPLLAICGGYQLLGSAYMPFDSPPILGISLFPVKTEASHDRMIGNLIIKSDLKFSDRSPQTIVGFENHSGKTYFESRTDALPLGKVLKGWGNNGADHTEGCIKNNAIGCYLHGSLLPKNPHLADWLIQKALEQKGISIELQKLDDQLELAAHQAILNRFA